ncbi:hypothetical protein ES707_20004 [subsurface metagenome]
MGSGALPLERGEHRVDPGVHQIAEIDGDKITGMLMDKAELPLGVNGEAGVISVMPRLGSGQGSQHRGIGEIAPLPQLPCHHLPLERQLKGIIDMLPLTAAALTEVRAAGLYPVGRFTEELHHLPHNIALPPLRQHDGFLAGDAIGGEHHFPIVPGQGITLRRDIGKG